MAFRTIARFLLGDGTSKALNFLVFIYLARVLGVDSYGTLEFALAVAAYLQFGADAGFELWGMRALARGKKANDIVGPVVTARVGLSVLGGGAILLFAGFMPDFPGLRILLAGLAFRVLVQAFDLRWVFMARQEMRVVGLALVAGSIVFAVAVVALVREPSAVFWVPLAQAAGHLLVVVFFWRRFLREPGARVRLRLPDWHTAVRPAFTMGASRGLALLSFNFDSLVIGFLLSSRAVGLYGAAYRPLTAVLAASSTFFLGLFPALARAYDEGIDGFRDLLSRSVHLMALGAIPVATVGVLAAEEILVTLVGPEYRGGAPALQLLACSAALVVLRGSFRQALCAADFLRADLWCAVVATALNVILNLWWIPRWGIVGAAAATLTSEVVWLVSIVATAHRCMGRLNWLWLRSVVPAALLAGVVLASPVPGGETARWVAAAAVYVGVLYASADTWVRLWISPGKRARTGRPT